MKLAYLGRSSLVLEVVLIILKLSGVLAATSWWAIFAPLVFILGSIVGLICITIKLFGLEDIISKNPKYAAFLEALSS